MGDTVHPHHPAESVATQDSPLPRDSLVPVVPTSVAVTRPRRQTREPQRFGDFVPK